jgi:hypothetical protein
MSSGDARIGRRLLAQDGEVGQIEDVLVSQEGVPRYLVVRDQGVFASDVVIPVEATWSDGAVVHSSLTKAQVQAGDRYDECRFGQAAGLFSVEASTYDRGHD